MMKARRVRILQRWIDCCSACAFQFLLWEVQQALSPVGQCGVGHVGPVRRSMSQEDGAVVFSCLMQVLPPGGQPLWHSGVLV